MSGHSLAHHTRKVPTCTACFAKHTRATHPQVPRAREGPAQMRLECLPPAKRGAQRPQTSAGLKCVTPSPGHTPKCRGQIPLPSQTAYLRQVHIPRHGLSACSTVRRKKHISPSSVAPSEARMKTLLHRRAASREKGEILPILLSSPSRTLGSVEQLRRNQSPAAVCERRSALSCVVLFCPFFPSFLWKGESWVPSVEEKETPRHHGPRSPRSSGRDSRT